MELGYSSNRGGELKAWRHAPWHVLLLATVVAGIGVWNLSSASRNTAPELWRSQVAWLGVGLAVCGAMTVFDYRYLLHLAYPVYGVIVALLLAVLLKGHAAMGARRWLDLGPVHLQPSELMKIGMVLVLARFFHEDTQHKDGYSLPNLWQPALLLLAPVALVMKQPDLGTAMIIAAVAGTMVLFAKVRWKSLAIAAAALVGAAVFAWSSVLKKYQRDRILTFLDPESDVLGKGYHATQSLIAVGSGRSFGKGWGNGTQTQLSFLPEQHTDFIFSVWGEEHGFVGAIILIGLYLLLLVAVIGVAAGAREKFGAFLAVGVAGILFWHVFVNIGMVTGVLPVVGVTLPLMSYGGSSVLTNMVALGLLMNVGMRRHLF